jgi:hypothetical protein
MVAGMTTPTADFNLGDALLTVLEIFLLVIWIYVVVVIFIDLFRDPALSGGKKAVWTLFLLFFPFITVFVYLIARGGGMRDRALMHQAEAQQAANSYIREAASSPADDLQKLSDLRAKGVISQEEYDQAKAKVLTG